LILELNDSIVKTKFKSVVNITIVLCKKKNKMYLNDNHILLDFTHLTYYPIYMILNCYIQDNEYVHTNKFYFLRI